MSKARPLHLDLGPLDPANARPSPAPNDDEPSTGNKGELILADPRRCRVWGGNSRDTSLEVLDDCPLMLSISEIGIVQPLKGRAVAEGPADFEIIAGARRLHRALRLREADQDIRVPVWVSDIPDEEACRIVAAENVGRDDLSFIERGRGYEFQLQVFQGSLRSFSRAIDVDASMISRLIALANLPAPILQIVEDVREMRFSWTALLPLLKNAENEAKALKEVERIREEHGRIPAAEALERLRSSIRGKRPAFEKKEIAAEEGQAPCLFQRRRDGGAVVTLPNLAMLLPADRKKRLDQLMKAIAAELSP